MCVLGYYGFFREVFLNVVIVWCVFEVLEIFRVGRSKNNYDKRYLVFEKIGRVSI